MTIYVALNRNSPQLKTAVIIIIIIIKFSFIWSRNVPSDTNAERI